VISSPGNAGVAAQTNEAGSNRLGVGDPGLLIPDCQLIFTHLPVRPSGSGGNFGQFLPCGGLNRCPALPCRRPQTYFSPSQPFGFDLNLLLQLSPNLNDCQVLRSPCGLTIHFLSTCQGTQQGVLICILQVTPNW
jgi:hypothetical protein